MKSKYAAGVYKIVSASDVEELTSTGWRFVEIIQPTMSADAQYVLRKEPERTAISAKEESATATAESPKRPKVYATPKASTPTQGVRRGRPKKGTAKISVNKGATARDALLAALAAGPVHRTALAQRAGVALPTTSVTLSLLKRDGHVVSLGEGRWALSRGAST